MKRDSYFRKIDYLEEDSLSALMAGFQLELHSFGFLELKKVKTIQHMTLPFHRILYLVEGEVTYEIKGERFHLKKGDILFTPSNCLYSADGAGSPACPAYYYLFFSVNPPHMEESFIRLLEGGTGKAAVFHALNSRTEYYFKCLLDEYRLKQPGFYLQLTCHLTVLLIEILRLREPERVKGQKNRSLETRDIALATATSYINGNLAYHFTVRELAAACNVSESYLYKLFRSDLGCSPQEYAMDCRLERGALLLASTDMTVTQIAGNLGFSSPNHFSNAFFKKTGSRPGAYRKANRQPGP